MCLLFLIFDIHGNQNLQILEYASASIQRRTSFIIFLIDDKQKTEGIPDGSNAVVILSSAFIRYYALDCCPDFGAGWANIHAQLVTVGYSMFLKH